MSISRRPRAGRISTKLILLVAGVPVLIVLVIGLIVMRGGGPELVVRQFMMAQAQRDVPTLLSLMTAKDADQIRQELGGKMPPPEKNPAPAPQLEFGKTELSDNGKRATVPLTVKGPVIPGLGAGALDQKQRIVLVLENGEWKVDVTATELANAAAGGGMGGEGAPSGMEQAPPPGESPSAAPSPAEPPPAATHAGKHKSSGP
jgi:hypothetical protein